MSLVEKVQELCTRKGLTLIGLEREIGLGRGSIRRWDENSPSIDKVKKVANYFNITVSELIGENEKTIEEIIRNNFSEEIIEIQKSLEKLSPEMKKKMLKMIKTFAEEE